jgi:hypothetical protein
MHLPFPIRLLILIGCVGWYLLVRGIMLAVDRRMFPRSTDRLFISLMAFPFSFLFGPFAILLGGLIYWVVTGA